MRHVLKFHLTFGMVNKLDIPQCGKVTLVGHQNGLETIWVEVDDRVPVENPRSFLIFGTGFSIPDNLLHVGSYQTPAGYVWHVYEVQGNPETLFS